MHRAQEQVREMCAMFGQPTSPAAAQIRDGELRSTLVLEEAMEVVVALLGSHQAAKVVLKVTREIAARIDADPDKYTAPNLLEAIDGLCDLAVVTYGTAEAIGVDLEPFFEEVHHSNMAKFGGEVREDGKRLKPPGWTPPNLVHVLERVETDRLLRERYELACEQLVAHPPMHISHLTADDWRPMALVDRQAHHWYWRVKQQMHYYMCLSCTFPATTAGVTMCEACR